MPWYTRLRCDAPIRRCRQSFNEGQLCPILLTPWRVGGHQEHGFPPMARVIFGVVLFSMVFAQATIIPALNPLNVSPDFVLLLLFVVTLFAGVREGLAWLFVAGILTDVLAMDPLGANGLALLPAVVLVEPARLPVFRANLLIPLVLVVVATLLHGLIQGLIRGIVPDITLVLQALLHAILFPLLYLLFRWLE